MASREDAGENRRALIEELNLPTIPRDTTLIIDDPDALAQGIYYGRTRNLEVQQSMLDTPQTRPLDAEVVPMAGHPGLWTVRFPEPPRGDVIGLVLRDDSDPAARLYAARFGGP
jgi:hypothetical protein